LRLVSVKSFGGESKESWVILNLIFFFFI
jgi:hypothetical protein